MIEESSLSSHSSHAEDDGGIVAPVPRLNPLALAGPVGEVVRLIEPHTEAHPAGLLLSMFAAVGACIGRSPYQLLDGSRHGVNLLVALTGPTSDGRKGTAVGWARRILSQVDSDFARVNVAGGLSSGEGVIYRVRDAAPAAPGEKSADAGVTDKRVLVIADELGGAFRKMQGRENTLAHVLREGFDGNTLRTLTRRDPMIASDPHIAMVGSITPEELRAATTDGDFAGGTINRLCLVYVERTRSLPRGGNPPFGAIQDLTARISRNVTTARSVGQIDLTDGAWEIWEEVYDDLMMGKPGRFGQATRRGAPIARRLAALYCLTDGRNIISALDMQAALAAWQYIEDSARYVFGGVELPPLAEKLLRALEEAPHGVTRSALRKAAGSNDIPAAKITAALIALREAGLARNFMLHTSGRPSEVWQLTRFYLIQQGKEGRNGKKGTEGPRSDLGEAA